jgi:VWFA-related protein
MMRTVSQATCVAAVAAVVAIGIGAAAHQTRPTFRAAVAAVSVNVSVKRGNNPVIDLRADDFRLFDNGVQQSVTAVRIEAVPVDVTVFHDTSPSQGRHLDDLKRDARRIAAILRDEDRFRLITFGACRCIVDVFGWTRASMALDLEQLVLAPISPVNDALVAALMHRPDSGRRHLVVALTDAVDAGSVVSSAAVREAAARAEAVMHIVILSNSYRWPKNGAPPFVPGGPDDSVPRLREAAELTGGRAHDRLFGSPDPVDEFQRVFDDFRTSYVLHFTPVGVEAGGWHELLVEAPGAPGATVRARQGYYGR